MFALAAIRAKTGAAKSALTGIGYAVTAGIFGGCTVLSAKILTECMRAGAPTAWLVLVGGCAGLCALGQLTTLNAAVGLYSNLLVLPIFAASSLATNASGGGIFFDEFAAFDDSQRRGYLQGVALLLSGVLLVASKSAAASASETPSKKRKAK